ncbi:hypothetical protein [Bradyrhizobium sp. NC92]|uniref:hypothetical protein n=1 Tax=Bradyrhizobium sp. (strain NC92) TaxID=55395 RepID=UPI0021A9EA3B|nr:hypothetical protein [Bradyrhizobium sp. NC92]UWU69456.1 hypothetical protein N2602_02690 [Bradyrhizobium sp. NC92]
MPFEKPDVDKWARTKALEVNCFDGLAIGDAFRGHVLEDEEVAELGRKALEKRPVNAEVFSEGRFPGPPFGFHWSLHLTAQSIASAFVSLPVIFIGQPLPSPSDEEIAVSRKLAERIGSFKTLLVRGELIAVGTAAATGLEAPIGRGQWSRPDLLLDVENSAVCEMRDHRPVAVWTGVWLQVPEEPVVIPQPSVGESEAAKPTKARKQIQTKDKSRRQCVDWLFAMMSDPTIEPMTNEQLWNEAIPKWPESLSKREFTRCRARALDRLSEEQRYLWERPGPRRRQS